MALIRTFSLAVLLLAFSCVTPAAVRAEMPPTAYISLQQQAPEWLEIEVLSVDAKPGSVEKREAEMVADSTQVTVQARVTRVHRSATHLRPDTKITIAYLVKNHKPGWVGPSSVPVLVSGAKSPAYLERTAAGTSYSPAAGGYSFETVKDRD